MKTKFSHTNSTASIAYIRPTLRHLASSSVHSATTSTTLLPSHTDFHVLQRSQGRTPDRPIDLDILQKCSTTITRQGRLLNFIGYLATKFRRGIRSPTLRVNKVLCSELKHQTPALGNDVRAYLLRANLSSGRDKLTTWSRNCGLWNCGVLPITPCGLTRLSFQRLWTGHTRLIHGHLLQGDPVPLCNHCDVLLTVLHILQETHVMKNAKYPIILVRYMTSSESCWILAWNRGSRVYLINLVSFSMFSRVIFLVLSILLTFCDDLLTR
jgi:hypothetical protein